MTSCLMQRNCDIENGTASYSQFKNVNWEGDFFYLSFFQNDGFLDQSFVLLVKNFLKKR